VCILELAKGHYEEVVHLPRRPPVPEREEQTETHATDGAGKQEDLQLVHERAQAHLATGDEKEQE
jgi:hypothetical protein